MLLSRFPHPARTCSIHTPHSILTLARDPSLVTLPAEALPPPPIDGARPSASCACQYERVGGTVVVAIAPRVDQSPYPDSERTLLSFPCAAAGCKNSMRPSTTTTTTPCRALSVHPRASSRAHLFSIIYIHIHIRPPTDTIVPYLYRIARFCISIPYIRHTT